MDPAASGALRLPTLESQAGQQQPAHVSKSPIVSRSAAAPSRDDQGVGSSWPSGPPDLDSLATQLALVRASQHVQEQHLGIQYRSPLRSSTARAAAASRGMRGSRSSGSLRPRPVNKDHGGIQFRSREIGREVGFREAMAIGHYIDGSRQQSASRVSACVEELERFVQGAAVSNEAQIAARGALEEVRRAIFSNYFAPTSDRVDSADHGPAVGVQSKRRPPWRHASRTPPDRAEVEVSSAATMGTDSLPTMMPLAYYQITQGLEHKMRDEIKMRTSAEETKDEALRETASLRTKLEDAEGRTEHLTKQLEMERGNCAEAKRRLGRLRDDAVDAIDEYTELESQFMVAVERGEQLESSLNDARKEIAGLRAMEASTSQDSPFRSLFYQRYRFGRLSMVGCGYSVFIKHAVHYNRHQCVRSSTSETNVSSALRW